jgi:Domain of unknown function (DUF5666)
MLFRRMGLKLWLVIAASAALSLCLPPAGRAALPPHRADRAGAQSAATEKQVGTVKAISGNTITLTTDAGAEVTVQVPEGARTIRVEPGQSSLKDAVPIHLPDLQPGDRILVRGKAVDDSKSLVAMLVIAMKHTDVQARQQQEREEWQKGIGGLVSGVDPSSETIAISVATPSGKKQVAIHTTKSTSFRRYAPGSVKFDDAKPSSIEEIKPGDQLRARGERGADESGFTAEAIVSGSFRNIAGTVESTDAAAGRLTVKDLASKDDVVVKVTPDSDVRKLSPQAAQFIAMRLRRGQAGVRTNREGGGPGRPPNGSGNGAMGGHPGMGRAGTPDFQQILNRMPHAQIADLRKGDAVMIVSTQGSDSGAVTAITLLAGVEPILEASPSQAMTLSPWSLGAAPSGGDEAGSGTPQQ